MKEKPKFKVVFNSPVILGFTIICVIALLLNFLTGGFTNSILFSVYRAPFSFGTCFRFFGHVIGHAHIGHLTGNFMMILVVGPMLEEKYGSKDLLVVMLVTAFVTGLIHFIFFPGVALLGASGIVFAFILLASFTGFKEREIPLTFILVAVLYLGQQIVEGVISTDNISQLTHIVGGMVGAAMGYFGAAKK